MVVSSRCLFGNGLTILTKKSKFMSSQGCAAIYDTFDKNHVTIGSFGGKWKK